LELEQHGLPFVGGWWSSAYEKFGVRFTAAVTADSVVLFGFAGFT